MASYTQLVDGASDAALAIGCDFRIVAWNARATAVLGYSPDEALGHACAEILLAVAPNGESICSPGCRGKHCFLEHVPFAVADCCVRHRSGRRFRASLSTLVPPWRHGKGATERVLAVILIQPREDDGAQAAARQGQLAISTLGRFSVAIGGRLLPVERWSRRHAAKLLKLLADRCGESLDRDYLIETLWPDVDDGRGRARLKVITHYLREQLQASGANHRIVAVSGSTFTLEGGEVWVDCQAFEKLAGDARRLWQAGRREEAVAGFELAVDLYRGDYLSEEPYADWCALKRERLREVHLDALGHLTDSYLAAGDCERATRYAEAGLALEPYREAFLLALMTGLVRLGRREQAIVQYQKYRQILREELGVAPSPQAERKYRQLTSAG